MKSSTISKAEKIVGMSIPSKRHEAVQILRYAESGRWEHEQRGDLDIVEAYDFFIQLLERRFNL